MSYSNLLHPYARLAPAVRRTFSPGRLGAAVTLFLALAVTVLSGTGGAYAQNGAAARAAAAVNINSADAATLAASLKGVGQSRAMEIVRYREAYGPFSSVDELTEVTGIGKSTLDENRELITLE